MEKTLAPDLHQRGSRVCIRAEVQYRASGNSEYGPLRLVSLSVTQQLTGNAEFQASSQTH